MPCKPIRGKDFTAIVCTRGRKPAACQEPGCTRPHTKLCDYPVTRRGGPATCDRKICDAHATGVGPDTDYCTAHARAEKDKAK